MTSESHVTSRPKVSIGLPVYNGESLITEAVESLLAQTVSDFELIIGDNASTDRTEEICRAFVARDPRIRYIRHTQNLGVFGNSNVLIREARGEYFMLAAHDDTWEENWIEVLLNNFDDSAILCFGEMVETELDGRVRRVRPIRPYSDNMYLRVLDYYLRQRWAAFIVYGMYKTEFIQRFRYREKTGRFNSSDIDFVFRLLHYGNVRFATGARYFKRGAAVQEHVSLGTKIKAYWENLSYYLDLGEVSLMMRASPDPVVKVAVWLLLPARTGIAFVWVNAIAVQQLIGRTRRRSARGGGDVLTPQE